MGDLHAALKASILEGIPKDVPSKVALDPTVDHAPDRPATLSAQQPEGQCQPRLRPPLIKGLGDVATQ